MFTAAQCPRPTCSCWYTRGVTWPRHRQGMRVWATEAGHRRAVAYSYSHVTACQQCKQQQYDSTADRFVTSLIPAKSNKKAVLLQRWPRDARYIGLSRSWAVAEITAIRNYPIIIIRCQDYSVTINNSRATLQSHTNSSVVRKWNVKYEGLEFAAKS